MAFTGVCLALEEGNAKAIGDLATFYEGSEEVLEGSGEVIEGDRRQ